MAWIRPLCLLVFMFHLVAGASRQTVPVPLHYEYLGGEAHWARFGAIDERCFRLEVAQTQFLELGSYTNEDDEFYILRGSGDVSTYFEDATLLTLSHYGVSFGHDCGYRLRIQPLRMFVIQLDKDDDGPKRCAIELCCELFDARDSLLVRAQVANEGVEDIEDGDESGYAALLDKTLHGALVKLWGSQVLFTSNPLGEGRVTKHAAATYGFTPQPLALPSCADSLFTISRSPLLHHASPTMAVSGAMRTGRAPSGEQGREVTVGLLPFENATGREELLSQVRSVQTIFAQTLSHSQVLTIMERERLSAILHEQALGLSGIMNDSTVVKVGELSGVKTMIAGRVSAAGSYYLLSARLINVETSAVVAGATVQCADILGLPECAAQLAARLLYGFCEERIEYNRNVMSAPMPCPQASAAVSAAVDDSWAVVHNPAVLMKLNRRDINFYFSPAARLRGTLDGTKTSTVQPLWQDIGTNVAIPLTPHIASGFAIRHHYGYPELDTRTSRGAYAFKQEHTSLTVPLGVGLNPSLSLGASLQADVLEYNISGPGRQTVLGSGWHLRGMAGALLTITPRFRAALTYAPRSLYEQVRESRTDEEEGYAAEGIAEDKLRVGIATYPLEWLFFFSDLQMHRFEHYSRIQPGFSLGMQLTHSGKLPLLPSSSAYGMLPVTLGYDHQPYHPVWGTQHKYLSIGSGYFVNNLYVRWSLRFSMEPSEDRRIALGSADERVQLDEYRFVEPLFITVGYRF